MRRRGHYWILSIPGVIKIRSQPRGTWWEGEARGEERKDPDRVYAERKASPLWKEG